jgi:hypothetical protein
VRWGSYLITQEVVVNPWLETFGVVVVAAVGIYIGSTLSKLGRRYWTAGYFLSLLLIVTLLICRWNGTLAFVPPFSWIITGRIKFVILALAATMGLTTPLSRLTYKFEKLTVCLLMAVVVTWFSILPFLVPALIKDQLANLETRIDTSGVCYQTTDYTCAPAAAVTALGKLGISATEGEIAILARTSPVAGTLPRCLNSALRSRYGAEGLRCQYRRFDSIDQLKGVGITLAVVRDRFLSDHCVAILEVSDRMVTIADPVMGKELLSYDNFAKIWRFSGIVLSRDSTHNI